MEGVIVLLNFVLVLICLLILVAASFFGGRNYERAYKSQQKAQPTIKKIEKKHGKRREVENCAKRKV